MRILVTGAGGVLCRQVVARLRAGGHEVIATGRRLGNGVDVRWDITAEAAPATNSNVAVVVHAAARMGRYQQPVSESLPLFETNTIGTLRVASWCAQREVPTLVLLSSAIVYGNWQDRPKLESDPVYPWFAGPYAASKWCAEQAAALMDQQGRMLCILRLSSLYGPGYDTALPQRLLHAAQETGQIVLNPPFDDRFGLLHARDAALTVSRVVEKPTAGIWNVGGGKTTSVQALASICAQASKAKLVLKKSAQARPSRIINWVDDTRARQKWGHLDSISLEEGIGELADQLKGFK
jgi:nucleoside-diphosphate-sugar epimerase